MLYTQDCSKPILLLCWTSCPLDPVRFLESLFCWADCSGRFCTSNCHLIYELLCRWHRLMGYSPKHSPDNWITCKWVLTSTLCLFWFTQPMFQILNHNWRFFVALHNHYIIIVDRNLILVDDDFITVLNKSKFVSPRHLNVNLHRRLLLPLLEGCHSCPGTKTTMQYSQGHQCRWKVGKISIPRSWTNHYANHRWKDWRPCLPKPDRGGLEPNDVHQTNRSNANRNSFRS